MAPGRRPVLLYKVERRQQKRGNGLGRDVFHLGRHRGTALHQPAESGDNFQNSPGLPFSSLEAHSCASTGLPHPASKSATPRVTEGPPQQSQDPPCSKPGWESEEERQGWQGKCRPSSLAHSVFSPRSRKAGWWCLSALLQSGLRFPLFLAWPCPHIPLSLLD